MSLESMQEPLKGGPPQARVELAHVGVGMFSVTEPLPQEIPLGSPAKVA
jgi:hypothetical protein